MEHPNFGIFWLFGCEFTHFMVKAQNYALHWCPKLANIRYGLGIYDIIFLMMILMLTCESVNRDIMADLFSGSFNNLQLSMMEYLVKKKRKKRSLCQKRFRPFHQSVTRVWEVLNKVILGGRETTKGIFCTSGWGQQKLFWSLFLNYFTKQRDLAS